MACAPVPSRAAAQIEPSPGEGSVLAAQYRWLPSPAIPPMNFACPVTMACALVPSRFASQTEPLLVPMAVQYRWPPSTVTQIGSGALLETMVCTPLPSRPASTIALATTQYRWPSPTATPVGAFWPLATACGPVPSAAAALTEPIWFGLLWPLLAQ